METNKTVFQTLGPVVNPQSVSPEYMKGGDTSTVLYRTNDREQYEKKLLQYRQQKYLSWTWQKAGNDVAMQSLAGYNAVKLMYRDADLMDGMPEIGAALDIISEEALTLNGDGQMLHVYSKSKRVKSILEDLFMNRLKIHTELPWITRAMVKYGNQFLLLNISKENGILGWKQLPVYEVDRWEYGMVSDSVGLGSVPIATNEIKPDAIRFVWIGHNEDKPYQNWMVAHFRLLNDSFFLPYGVSALHKARRAWRMWSMMEDAMLIYRLDKSIERRVFKIYVGGIDEQDVQAFVQDIANNFKRTPIIDPLTGQVDLRKNFMDVSTDYFIPVRDPATPSPIETLQSANNPTAMDDIQYMQNKVFSALRVPKAFLNFQEAQGRGQNLSLLDIRFCRMINRVQQFVIMELNKVAMIHLHLLGLDDELSNFTLTLNNPSAQIEALELEDITKRVQTAVAAVADPGTGIPLVSVHWALKKILKLSDEEILDILNEIRLEKAMAFELQATQNIIKKTGMFDRADRMYGDFDAMIAAEQGGGAPQQQQQDDAMGGAAGGAGGGGFEGGSLNMDSLGGGDSESVGGSDATMDMGSAPAADNGTPTQDNSQLNESRNFLRRAAKSYTQQYFDKLNEDITKDEAKLIPTYDYEARTVSINEDVKNIFNKLGPMLDEDFDDDDFDEDDDDFDEDEDK